MLLHGSCSCHAVKFSVESRTPYPYMRCYCSICRKTAGGGGYAINIMGVADTLEISGGNSLSVYRAKLDEKDNPGEKVLSQARRHFCNHCGTFVWISDPRWPKSVFPFASAIDTPLPKPPENAHIMLDSAAPWVDIPTQSHDEYFREYPEEAIIDWHKRHGLYQE